MTRERFQPVKPRPVSPDALREHLAVISRLLDGNLADAAGRLRSDKPGPGKFLRFAERNFLGGFLTGLLDAPELRGVFPAEELDMLLSAARRRKGIQSAIVDEISRLWPRLKARGIDAILLKGPWLAERFAPARTFVDLDLLVRARQIGAFEALLAQMGFRRISQFLLTRAISMRFVHGFDFARDRLRVDAHWCFGSHISYKIDYDRVWRDSRPFHLSSGDEVQVLSDEDSVFFLLLSIFEDIDRGAFRLRSFVDLHAMLSQLDPQIDWTAFWEQRRAERTLDPCQAVLALFFVLLSAEKDFPRAAASAAAATERTRGLAWSDITALVQANQGSLRNKRWGLQHYECGVFLSVFWWSVSLPFRLMIYRRRP